MNRWTKRMLAIAAPLFLTGCLWGPGKFVSDLTLKKDGTFALDYRGEMVLRLPPEDAASEPWKDTMARCYSDGRTEIRVSIGRVFDVEEEPPPGEGEDNESRPCTAAELANLKSEYVREAAEKSAAKRKENEEMAKAFGLPGLDDQSNRAFAAKLMKYQGWRSVSYRGNGIFDVDYHFEGRATQDFLFPMLPGNDLIIPFVAMRRRADGTILVTAPAMTGGSGQLAGLAGAAGAGTAKGGPVSRAEGRFTLITDGEILTNNSEEGTSQHALGRQVRWDVNSSSTKVPETLVRLQ